MSDDDFKVQVGLLTQKLEYMREKIDKLETESSKKFDKIERGVNWVTLLIVGSVIATVLKQIGLT